MKNELIHDKENQMFVLKVEDGGKAFVEYEEKDGVLHLIHSEVPEEYRGKGVGRELVLKTFEQIEVEGAKAMAHCGYVKHIKNRHEKWSKIID